MALWFRARLPDDSDPDDWDPDGSDPRAYPAKRDPMLHALCARIFPDGVWTPADARASAYSGVPFADPPRPVDDPDGLGELFTLLDRDGDGQLGPYEGSEALLFLTSKVGDALTLNLLRRHLEALRDEERAERAEFFAELDASGDGRVLLDALPEGAREFLVMADEDGDGVITLDELLRAPSLDDPEAMFEQELLGFLEEVDHDGDGAFALSDLSEEGRVEFEPDFHELDTDDDGFVTRAELLALLDEEMRGAEFAVEGERAVMTGVIGPSTPGRVLELVLEHPGVRTIVMQDVPGSMDDESNLRAARYVRRLGLATHVPAGGMVASGGTDFFLAGATRSAAPDALRRALPGRDGRGGRRGPARRPGAREVPGVLPRDGDPRSLLLAHAGGGAGERSTG